MSARPRSEASLPRDHELRAMLVQRPALLEPGMQVHSEGLRLAGEVEVGIVGEDAVGRPVLVLRETDFEAAFYDRLLQLAVHWRSGAGRLPVGFRRLDEPRFVLLVRSLPEEAARRLELLRPALPLRVRMVVPGEGSALPRFLPAGEAPCDVDALAAELAGEDRLALLRVLRACAAIRPALRVEGSSWPLVLRGTDGPCASLHAVDGRLHFAVAGPNGPECRALRGEERVDHAIDLLLRRQAGVIAVA